MRQEKLFFQNSRGTPLCGVLHHPNGAADPHGSVILCHGMDSDKNSAKLVYLGEALAERGVPALRFDFAYVGESGGKFEDITYSGEVDDLTAAYRWIRSRHPGKTAILGSSMGGTVALMFAAQEPRVAALVTIAAPLHPENFPKRMLTPAQIRDWRRQGFTTYQGRRLNASLLDDLEQIDVVGAARRIMCPVLILHGDADDVVPVTDAYELDGCLSGPSRLEILKDSDHRLSDPIVMQQALTGALAWLSDHVR